jgi:hypothetical protein
MHICNFLSPIAGRSAWKVVLPIVAASLVAPSAALADHFGGSGPFEGARSKNWGVSVRNTIGSPVAELREGMSSRLTPGGNLTRPPFGTGSLGLEVSVYPGVAAPPGESKQEKVDFGNEVDFFGDRIAALNEVGFHVFQTGENVGYGGPTNMPNIRFEIDPPTMAFSFSTMVWVPGPSPVTNAWSPYIDATATGFWFFTGAFGAAPPVCSQATPCTFAAAKTKAGTATVLSVLVGKGRDNMWIGAVDGLRLNDTIYDFEAGGVAARDLDDDDDHDDDDDDN